VRHGFARAIHPGWRVLRFVLLASLAAMVVVVLASAFTARSLPDLEPWHRWTFPSEPDVGRLRDMDWNRSQVLQPEGPVRGGACCGVRPTR